MKPLKPTLLSLFVVKKPRSGVSAFTLFELLLVMSLIATLLGLASQAMTRPGNGVALSAAQQIIRAEVSAVAALAKRYQVSARLFISAEASRPDRFLRTIWCAREGPAESGHWQSETLALDLPTGICFVPPSVATEQSVEGVSWPGGSSAPLSHLAGPVSLSLNEDSVQRFYYIEVSPDGSVFPADAQLAVATVRNSLGGMARFDNPQAVRGARLNANGSVRLLNHAQDF